MKSFAIIFLFLINFCYASSFEMQVTALQVFPTKGIVLNGIITKGEIKKDQIIYLSGLNNGHEKLRGSVSMLGFITPMANATAVSAATAITQPKKMLNLATKAFANQQVQIFMTLDTYFEMSPEEIELCLKKGVTLNN